MRSLSDANTLLATNYSFQQVEEGEKSILTESNYQIPDFLLTTPQIRQRKDNTFVGDQSKKGESSTRFISASTAEGKKFEELETNRAKL